MNKEIRLQKYLAERGVASRRHSAEMIAGGRIAVNGRTVTEPGFRIDPGSDTVSLDGDPLSADRERFRTIMMYKPVGVICSASEEQGRTVYEFLQGVKERLVPVGRLDKASEGLLLLSNDGELVNRLTHPRYGHAKTYRVTVDGRMNPGIVARLQSRMVIDGYRIQPVQVRFVERWALPDRFVLEFTLKEGRKRQIRQMCEQVDLRIVRLVRVSLGSLTLSGLKPGQWRDLTGEELQGLRQHS